MSPRASDEDLLAIVAAFHEAAVGERAWTDAMAELARATGSRRGQLIGFRAGGEVPFNWLTDTAPEAGVELAAVGGNSPAVNSRIRLGVRAPELAVLDESDFDTEGDARRNPAYGDYVRRWDVPFICLTNLLKQADLTVGLSVLRSAAEGPISDEQRRVFAALAPHVRAAVRLQATLENQGAALVAGALESLSLTAFVCDRDGRVRALTPAAEALARDGAHLASRGGRLMTPQEPRERLADAIAAAAAPRLAAPPASLVVRDRSGGRPLMVEVSSLPRRADGFDFGLAALVVARRPGQDARERRTRAAVALFGLTPTEARIAAELVGGAPPADVAEQLSISLGTVRTHIRNLYAKAEVTNQLTLAAKLNAAS